MNTDQSKTILVVEDDADILFTLKLFLESENYHVLTAENGLVALQILEKNKMPNIILIDMKMPVMSGWEFVKFFKIKYDQKIPIIVMSAAADTAQRAKDIDATDWTTKPFDLNLLLKKIKQHEL